MIENSNKLFYLPQYRESIIDRITNAYFKRDSSKQLQKSIDSTFDNHNNQASTISLGEKLKNKREIASKLIDPIRSGQRMHKQS
jgi:uncharacterized protein YjhX (UPF0386 family)